jgi:ATP-dependent Lon protease
LPKLSGTCFAHGVGLKSDFFGDALVALRNDLEHDQRCARRIQLNGEKVYKRNEDALRSIASGLLKIMFPDGQISDTQFDYYCVRPAKKLRQIIWDQLQILDAEYRQYESDIRYEILPD